MSKTAVGLLHLGWKTRFFLFLFEYLNTFCWAGNGLFSQVRTSCGCPICRYLKSPAVFHNMTTSTMNTANHVRSFVSLLPSPVRKTFGVWKVFKSEQTGSELIVKSSQGSFVWPVAAVVRSIISPVSPRGPACRVLCAPWHSGREWGQFACRKNNWGGFLPGFASCWWDSELVLQSESRGLCEVCVLQDKHYWHFCVLLLYVCVVLILMPLGHFEISGRTHRFWLRSKHTGLPFMVMNKMFFTQDSSPVFSLPGPEMIRRWFVISAHWCQSTLRLVFLLGEDTLPADFLLELRAKQQWEGMQNLVCVCVVLYSRWVLPRTNVASCSLTHNLWCNEAEKIWLGTLYA